MSTVFIDKYIIHNQLIEENTLTNDLTIGNTSIIYEVFRIVGGKPLFLAGHLQRLNHSLLKLGIDYQVPNEQQIRSQISALCQANNKYFGNVEISVIIKATADIVWLMGFIPHYYPEPVMYIEGFATQTLVVERINPNIKVKDTNARQMANQFIKEHGLYEVLLQNSEGFLTEGSRSNLFFIKNQNIFTAPESMVLPGITRLRTIQVIEKLNYTWVEKAVHADHLADYQAAFICGTSPGILPINTINSVRFEVNHPVMRQLIEAYNALVTDYLKSNSQ